MALGNLLILTQVMAYLLAVIFALFMFIPMAVNLGQFDGHCLLNANGHWTTVAGKDLLDIDHWGLSANCNFPIFVGIIGFPIALFYVFWMSIYLFKGTEPSWLAAFSSLILNCVICLFYLISGSVITHGFSSWCSVVEKNIHMYSCSIAPYEGQFLVDSRIDSSGFYIQFEVSKFGAWTSWICWIILIACSSIQLYRYHSREDFFVSMNRERQRLIQRVRNPENESV